MGVRGKTSAEGDHPEAKNAYAQAEQPKKKKECIASPLIVKASTGIGRQSK
jgi:hypothetical protein